MRIKFNTNITTEIDSIRLGFDNTFILLTIFTSDCLLI